MNNQSYTTCYTDTTDSDKGPGDIVNGSCNDSKPTTGNTVRISLPSNLSTPLTLCQVRLFVCSEGWYGEMCDNECVTDTCCYRCDDHGLWCEKCVNGRWGTDCGEECGHCWNNTACDKDTSECPNLSPRCESGFQAYNCTSNCSSYTWGPDCKETCGQCHGGAVCDRVSGDCPLENPRCAIGYTGPRCEPCPGGTFGDHCQEKCGQCKDGSHTCDHVNGTCTSCADGWLRDLCKEAATLLDGSNIEMSVGGIAGGVSGGVVLLVVVVVFLIIRRRRRGLSQKDPDAELQPSHLMARPQHDDPVPQHNIEYDDDDEDDEDVAADVASAGLVNPGRVPESTCVPVEEFRRYMLRKKTSAGFNAEFETFPVGLHAKHDVAYKPENKNKSRYRNLVAYDHSRVHLKKFGDEDTDYINACYIDGYNEPKKYIASQGPTDVIINEFMRMIWEQNTGKVVMVTNLVEKTETKCVQYWPDGQPKQFGFISVSLLDEENFSNYAIRTLQLKHLKMQNKTQLVKQFHFTAWPDHGAPSNASSLLDFQRKVLGHKSPLIGPIVVHCSAGIGRTGTFIALDYLINQAKEEGVVDVPACVRLLREQRVNMVQSLEQYEFLHEALAEALELQEGSIPGVNFSSVFADLCTVNPETGQLKIAEQFQRLNEKTPPLDKATLGTALHPDNLHKNRSDKIVAADNCRPYLSTPVAGKNNYINAVFLPSYMLKRGFIITHMPLPKTVVDFWRLVYDHGVATIVMLDDVDNESENVGIYWTEKKKSFGPFDVKCTQKEEESGFTVWTYNLAYKDAKVSCPIKQFRCGFWSTTPSCASVPSLLAVIDGVTSWQKVAGNQPILVHCRDGLTNSGLFCAASFVLERLKLDRDVNIPQAVKQMRVARPQIITDLDQFQFLHQVALAYLETFHTYANFK
ncbi:receptor-type tyrosine-protein phosphatase kappa-like [Liolophura sinensis]|uniref:receptor-type tyrosine-protein phosphatase kappa-like n=1 Tax=Liolophura sinensis TaxID=3198878 RepID=UPI00315959E1